MACVKPGYHRTSYDAQSAEIILAKHAGDEQRSGVLERNKTSIEQGIYMHREQKSVEGVKPLSVRGASPRLDVGST